jgi:hypothetical protein
VITIVEQSVQSLLVVPTVNGQELAQGTGFVVTQNNQPYLITNYHVAAGRNPINGQPMSSTGAIPDALKIFHLFPGARWEPREERVLDAETETALWLHHPVHERTVDVVALPLKNVANAELHPYRYQNLPDIKAGPAEGVSIIGFPFGLTGGGNFAIWTRGFVASEPEVDLDGLPRFLVDARTRQGQSGSPVITYSPTGLNATSRGVTLSAGPPISKLLGVYSGRVNKESDLGYVWKVAVIEEILSGQKLGRAGL